MMRIEMLPGMGNVVRFPVERRARPTLALMREISPDVREVLAIADSLTLAVPVDDLRDRVDAETAAHIAAQVPPHGASRGALLTKLIEPAVVAAIAAIRLASDVSLDATEAHAVVLRAQTSGHYWIEPLRERALALTVRAAELLVVAYTRVEEAEGVARAVDLARRGEAWTPRDLDAEFEALLAMRRAG
jgi:hypothetical protein